jgi:5-methylcytosine-specific restriction endonuclease McrBC GTP-binding regulatory subunit McrB
MKFELKNGIFKEMCIAAFKNLIESINDKSKLKKYYFIADEINRAELSRVFGELLVCLEDDKRLRINGNKVEGTYVKTQNSNLWNDEHIVVRVNENGVISQKGDGFFGVPENIYFIGTMNDIDRSIDSFDMALRRRFVWKNYRCDYEIIEAKYNKNTKEELEDYIDICQKLNTHITSDSGFNLSNSYELGHAYFLKPKKLNKKEIDRVWREHISPILREYLRSEYQHNEIEKKLKEAKDKFTLGK